MKFFGIYDTPEDPALLTLWSGIHFLAGMAGKRFGMSLGAFFILHGFYEIKDVMGTTTNSNVNSLADQACATLGHIYGPTAGSGFIWFWLIAAGLGHAFKIEADEPEK